MNCITVLFLIISTDVYCHMFTTAPVTRDLNSPATGIALRIMYTLVLAAIAERPGVQGVAFKATSSRWTRQLTVNHLTLLATLRCITQTLNQTVSGPRRPNITWRV
jgi:hypothetical protein